ncbi:methyl-accepting chemotaxis protein, partial [Kushneria phosphatilytica]
MSFKSIRTFVVVTAGTCLLAVVVALVLYALMAMNRMQSTSAERTGEVMEQAIGDRLDALVNDQASRIQRKLDHAMTVAAQLAALNELMGKKDADGWPQLMMTRKELSAMVRQTLATNPELLDVFIGWEPDAFGSDAEYTGREEDGYDGSGRFMPWWYRKADGSLAVLPLGDTMESTKRDDAGIREGEYYLCPKETGKRCVIDPKMYDYNGVEQMVTSFNVPIMVNGEFRGSAGTDLSLAFIQQMLGDANQSLYDGAGSLALVAGNGRIVANSADAASLGKPAEAVMGHQVAQMLAHADSGKVVAPESGEQSDFARYLSFPVAGTDSHWTLVARIPRAAALAPLMKLEQTMTAQRNQAVTAMSVVGLIIAALGLMAIAWVGHRIARPLRHLAERMREIASGDGDLTQRLPVHGRDESALLAEHFNAFVERMRELLVGIRASSESVRRSAGEIASGGQELSKRTEQTAASLEESAAAMEQLSGTVSQAADSARQANEMADQAATAARGGGEEIQQVVSTMDEIRDASRRIAGIVEMIDSIAFQTNLLAL